MEQNEEGPKGGRRSYEIGPVGRRVADNLQRIRKASGLSQDGMAAAVRRLGSPMNRSAISKAEDAKRHIDVDDLVAFALALRSTPNRLLLTGTADVDKAIEVTPSYSVTELDAWMWVLGERPLDRGFDAPELQIVIESDRERWFTQSNRPNHRPEHPLADQVRAHPELFMAVRKLAREARRYGVGVQDIHYALEYAYLWDQSEEAADGQG